MAPPAISDHRYSHEVLHPPLESKGDPGHLSQDIVDSRSAGTDAAGLVIARGVEGQLADQRPVVGEDTDVLVGDQEVDGFAAVSPADPDVVEAAEVAESDRPGLIDMVVTDPEVSLGGGPDGVGLEAGIEGDQGGAAVKGPMGPVVVVKGTEAVGLELELGEGARGWLAGQEALEGLVEAFDLAAGLGVVGGGMLGEDAEGLQLGFDAGRPDQPLAGGGGAGLEFRGRRRPRYRRQPTL
jgi:hypothetical protein